MDVLLAAVLFILFLPVFILLTGILFFAFRGKPFFTQARPGMNEHEIRIIKFRSMTDARDDQGNLLPNMERTTKLGGFIRRTSLDEVPQLINVLTGDLSLVGPRPLLFKYLPLYSAVQRRRHEVKPGITGWAQVNGRNAISWKEKFEFDVYYVDHLSLALDTRILLMTIRKVFVSKDVNASKTITMMPFDGTN